MRTSRAANVSADRDAWTRQAFDACEAAAKDLIGNEGPIRPGVPIGRLTKSEWGWFVSTVLWAWISTRAEQAATEGWNSERAIGSAGLDPDPRMAGAVAAILPNLAEACPELDWSKEDIVEFLGAAFELINEALRARDAIEDRVLGTVANPDVIARKINAAAGNSLMTKDELNDSVPF
jgi:hypothetical protein